MPSKREITSNSHRLAPAYLGGEADEICGYLKMLGVPETFRGNSTSGEGRIRGGDALQLL